MSSFSSLSSTSLSSFPQFSIRDDSRGGWHGSQIAPFSALSPPFTIRKGLLLDIAEKPQSELVEGHWFRQAQPTLPHFMEKIPQGGRNRRVTTCRSLSRRRPAPTMLLRRRIAVIFPRVPQHIAHMVSQVVGRNRFGQVFGCPHFQPAPLALHICFGAKHDHGNPG